jgi:GTP cyclohydrolase I
MNERLIRDCFKLIIEQGLGLSLDDPNLVDTPKRMARMYCHIFRNVNKKSMELTLFPNKGHEELIMLDRIHFVSWCSHHFLPFEGYAWMAYIPDKWIVGASKPARLIEFISARPSIQEDLCTDVISAFDMKVEPKGSILVMRAIHSCMRCRGVQQSGGAGMITSALSGVFKRDAKARAEAMDLIKLSMMQGMIE